MDKLLLSVAILALTGAAPALAQTTPAAGAATVNGDVTVNGAVAQRCSGGTVAGGDSVFDLGVMIDTTTGLLLTNLSAPPKTVTGAFCNSASTITVTATPMVASSFAGTPPAGFTNQVDYTATASGWTTTPATFTTNAASNPNAVQSQPSPFAGVITVAISGFTPVGGTTLRMVADPKYQGEITITLAVAS